MDNCFLVDWFSATCKLSTYSLIFDVLGLDLCKTPFEDKKYSLNGFHKAVYYGGISVYFDNSQDEDLVWVEMSGQGCRTFETFSSKSFADLFRLCYPPSRSEKPFFHLSRLDIAYDIFDDPFLFDRMKFARDSSVIVSQLSESLLEEKAKIICGSPTEYLGRTLYFGSPKSDLRYRLYDKRLERGREDIDSWYRFEVMYRNDKAAEVALNYCHYVLDDESLTIGNIFCSYLDKYISVRERGTDSNPRRWRVAPWWSEFIQKTVKLKKLEKKETIYNIDGYMYNFQRQSGNTFDVLYQTIGYDGILRLVRERSSELNPFQIDAIHRFNRQREQDSFDIHDPALWEDVTDEFASDV